MSKYLFTTLILFCIFFNVEASDKPDEPIETRPFQLSVFPAVGTEGQFASQYIYNFSVNIFAGLTGGVDGIELGGFANINRYSMKGFQAAGFTNIVNGSVNGLQGAGFGNIVNGPAEGLQGAGFVNIATRNSRVLQGAGFGNVVMGENRGIQGAGFINVAGEVKGVQGAGFINVSGDSEGVQGAGFINVAGKASGVQGAGFINVSGDFEGVQGAGFINVAGNVKGLQLAGFVNVAREVEGVQLGLVNITNSIDGIPVGLLSIVRDGYRKVEFSAGDAVNANIAFKIGVRRFYNIFSVGTQFIDVNPEFTYGYGIGSEFYLPDSRYLNIELVSHQLIEGDWWDYDNRNRLNQVKVMFAKDLSDKWQVFAGPVLNFNVTEKNNSGTFVAPYRLISYSGTSRVTDMWIGINAGFRFW